MEEPDTMDDKIGVFICTGYGIADALDIDALSKVATEEFKVTICRTVDSCEGPGLEAILAEVESEGLNKICIADGIPLVNVVRREEQEEDN